MGDYTLLQLYTGYSLLSSLFQVTEKVGLIVYQLDIPKEWQIHLVFLIAYLEPCLPLDSNSFAQSHFYNLDSVYIERDIDLVQSFKLERLISKR